MNDQVPAFVTIITRDYYWWAKTWADSVAEHHPEADVWIAIADRPTEQHLQSLQHYRVLSVPELAGDLGLDEFSRMAFQYTPFELTCALKPFVMKYLHQQYARVIYLDADTLVYRPLDEAMDQLEKCEITATAHLSQPAPTQHELKIRAAGAINGGFLATRRGSQSTEFLKWWLEKCRFDCCIDPYAGKFVDQCWLDLAVHYFDAFQLLHDDSFNVAYWNLDARSIRVAQGQFLVNDRPLAFFHFSGLDPQNEASISRFDQRDPDDNLRLLRQSYVQRLLANRCSELDRLNCEYLCYRDGRTIDPVHREAIRGQHAEFSGILDPFDTLNDPAIPEKFEMAREQLILARKHWQLEELQKSADRQTQWIQKQKHKRLDKRIAKGLRRLCSVVKAQVSPTKSGDAPKMNFQSGSKVA